MAFYEYQKPMKILKHTDSELSIKDQSNAMGLLLLLLFGVLFGGTSLLASLDYIDSLEMVRLSCQRTKSTQINCTHTQSYLMGVVPRGEKYVGQVTAAEVKSTISSDSDGDEITVNWIALHTNSGEITYLTESVVDREQGLIERRQAAVDKINRFLESSDAVLHLRYSNHFWIRDSLMLILYASTILAGAAAIGYSILGLLSFPFSQTLIFDKSVQQFHYIRHTPFGKKKWQCPFSKIWEVTIDDNRGHHNEGYETFTLKVMAKGKTVFIKATRRAQVEQVQNLIKQFLPLS